MLKSMSVFFILLIISFSQTIYNDGNFRVSKLLFENNSKEKGITHFSYNENNQCDVAIWELENGQRYSLNRHVYKDNNLIEKIREYSDHNNSRQIFKYDDKNRMVSEEFILMDSSKGVTTFEYDENNRLIQMNCCGYNGWLTAKIKFEYKRDYRIRGEVLKNDKLIAEIYYKYNSFSLPVEEIWTFSNGYEQKFKYIYEQVPVYNELKFSNPNVYLNPEKKEQVIEEDYDFGGKGNNPSFYKYDRFGKQIEKLYERGQNFKTVTYYLYDGTGILTRAFRKVSDGKNVLFRYYFNGYNQMTEKRFFRNDSLNGYEKYFYNYDKLTKAEFRNLDFWLNGTATYQSDERGFIISGDYTDETGFKGIINFTYNRENKLNTIEWKFSSGQNQKYTFKY